MSHLPTHDHDHDPSLQPRPKRALLVGLTALFIAATGFVTWQVAQTLVVEQAIGESRTVADMAENIGRWASKYGGIHVRTQGAKATLPGNFLTRVVYAQGNGDASVLSGARVEGRAAEREAMERLEAYHWKNPALVQREVADVVRDSGSKAQFRLTAQTVLNRNNAPNAFEREALDVIRAAFDQGAAAGSDKSAASKNPAALEYWTERGGRLLYARAVLAQPSCLRCHDTPDKAPEFLRTNLQFNGGGGFGYVAGKPAGLVSVSVPLPDTWATLTHNMPVSQWIAGAVALLAGLGMLAVGLGARSPRR